MVSKTFTFLFVVHLSLVALAQNTDLQVSDPELIDESYSLYQAGDFFLAGQPTEKNLDSLINAGVTHVINLRTKDEMDMMSFDEKAFLKKRKIKYVHIPMGGDEGYQPEMVDKMGKSLRSAEGKVLVHCRGAGRATYTWMAWLVNYNGYSIDEAIRLGNKARFFVPFFDLLGYPVTIEKQ